MQQSVVVGCAVLIVHLALHLLHTGQLSATWRRHLTVKEKFSDCSWVKRSAVDSILLECI